MRFLFTKRYLMHELVLRLGRKLQEGEEVSVEGSTSDIVSKSLFDQASQSTDPRPGRGLVNPGAAPFQPGRESSSKAWR